MNKYDIYLYGLLIFTIFMIIVDVIQNYTWFKPKKKENIENLHLFFNSIIYKIFTIIIASIVSLLIIWKVFK